jgi:hypothetical protein
METESVAPRSGAGASAVFGAGGDSTHSPLTQAGPSQVSSDWDWPFGANGELVDASFSDGAGAKGE